MSSEEDLQDDFEFPVDELENLKPNFQGHYSLCFHCHCRQPPLLDKDEIKELFSPVAPVVGHASFRGLQFVRFSTKSHAIKAWKRFRKTLKIKVADHRKNVYSDEPNEIENTNANRKSQDNSTNNNSGVMLYLGNINTDATKEEIQEFMSEINVLEWDICKKYNKSYAFLKVSNHKEAERAIEMFNGKTFMGRTLFLRVFRTFERGSKLAASDMKTRPKTNNKDGSRAFAKVDNSSFHDNEEYQDLKTEMPPLENIVLSSSDDDDDDDDDTNINLENTEQANLNNFFHLFVGNFPYGTSEVNLMKLFQPYHPVKVIITNGDDISRSTQGFVCFSNPRDLEKASVELDCAKYKGHILLVTTSICSMNIPKDKGPLQCTITAVPGESQYQRKVMVDIRNGMETHKESFSVRQEMRCMVEHLLASEPTII